MVAEDMIAVAHSSEFYPHTAVYLVEGTEGPGWQAIPKPGLKYPHRVIAIERVIVHVSDEEHKGADSLL